MISLYHDKDIDMLKLGCTLPNLANICLHQSTERNSILPQWETRTYWKKFEKTSLVVHVSFLHAKQLLKFLSESLQTYANLLLNLTPANYTSIRCFNTCRPVFIRVGISIQKPVNSYLDQTRPVALKRWSRLIFNEQDLIVNLRASSISMKKILDVALRRELDELRRCYIQQESLTVIEMCEGERWRLYKTTTNVKLHIRENFPYRRSPTEHQLLE